LEVRTQYKAQDLALLEVDEMLQANGYGLRQRSETIFNLRNQLRQEGQALMTPEELAKLQARRAGKANAAENLSFDDFIADKMSRKGLSYEDALRDTIQSSAKSNPLYDQKAGL
jgi:hypothetical protein